MSQYYLKLNHFEGPLDLLLYLVRVNEINIFDINMFVLTNQYMAYLRLIRFNDLGDASAFLEMAATLVEIKSRMLLPATGKAGVQDDENDPRKALQDQLIELEMFRTAAGHLARLASYDVRPAVSREWSRLEQVFSGSSAPLTGDPVTLLILFEQMLSALADKKPVVEAKTHFVTVDQKIVEIAKLLEEVKFTIFQGFYPSLQSRYELVIYIMAVLELAKMGRVKVYQDEMNGAIWVAIATIDEQLLPRNRDGAFLGLRDETSSELA